MKEKKTITYAKSSIRQASFETCFFLHKQQSYAYILLSFFIYTKQKKVIIIKINHQKVMDGHQIISITHT